VKKTGETIRAVFTIVGTAGLVDADSLPTGVLYLNGAANAATVTVTKLATGKYKAVVTVPTVVDGDDLALLIDATVDSVPAANVVWIGDGCTARPADVYQLLAAQRVIDMTTTPWQLVLKDRTSGVEIMRFDLLDEDGDPIDSIATFVAEQTTPA
jgi:hypothetical protein